MALQDRMIGDAERQRRAVDLVRSLKPQIQEAWSRAPTLADPVLVVRSGGMGHPLPGVQVRSAAETARDLAPISPPLAAHLQHVDTSVPRVVVLLHDGVMMLSLGGDSRPCEACRRAGAS
jgi:hypothetical protein